MKTALALFLCGAFALDGQSSGPVLVLAPDSRAYLHGAGGTLAKMIAGGRPVCVLLFGSEEKDSAGLDPSQARLAAARDAERAAKALGVKEVLRLDHPAGEFGRLSTSELRNQTMAMMRLWKPSAVFFPDWYAHYVDDQDLYWTGRMAEESPYGGGSYFLQEMTYIGWPGFAAREYYFYNPYRPYRAREGGEGQARLTAVDITGFLERKLEAIGELRTSNYHYAAETRQRLERAGRPGRLLAELTPAAVENLARAYAEELAGTAGRARGLRFAEEFNHLEPAGGLPAHIREKARPADPKPPQPSP